MDGFGRGIHSEMYLNANEEEVPVFRLVEIEITLIVLALNFYLIISTVLGIICRDFFSIKKKIQYCNDKYR